MAHITEMSSSNKRMTKKMLFVFPDWPSQSRDGEHDHSWEQVYCNDRFWGNCNRNIDGTVNFLETEFHLDDLESGHRNIFICWTFTVEQSGPQHVKKKKTMS